jgi:molybdenum cofactor guanylyltransferase
VVAGRQARLGPAWCRTLFIVQAQPRSDVSLLILAGGRATRLGGVRKALLEIGGRPILARVVEALGPLADEWLALVHDRNLVAVDGLKILVDPAPRAGVLPALRYGLRMATRGVCLVVAGDMPFVQGQVFEYLVRLQRDERERVVIPRVDGILQPMHCVVDRLATLEAIDAALHADEHRLFRVLESLSPRIVDEPELRTINPDLRTLFNINTPEDLAQAERIAIKGER